LADGAPSRIAIRADASTAIGSGHVMRCLTLAEALRRAGGEIVFLCRRLPGHLGDEIARRGFTVSWAAGAGEDDPAAVPCVEADLLIVDHYGIDWRWEAAMRPRVKAIMVIDDLSDRPHDCDLLLDQNLLSDLETRYRGLVPAACRLLLGPGYALLRDEFYAAAARVRERVDIKHLLIFFGGGDPDNLTGRALRELHETDFTADVVIGASNPHRDEIAALCRAGGGRYTLHVQTGRMAELMARADLALGAGGGSHWERCLLGLPALVVTVADNQIETTRLLHDQGACRRLGDAANLLPGAFLQALTDLKHHPRKLTAMSRAARAIVPKDGGTERVVEAVGGMVARS
jgi:UDP-2,4-diacetamido-2,4,6-trideoxy-beta-L-altropyranose hydrolase